MASMDSIPKQDHSSFYEVGLVLIQPARSLYNSAVENKKTTLFVLAIIAYLVAYNMSSDFEKFIINCCQKIEDTFLDNSSNQILLGVIGGLVSINLWMGIGYYLISRSPRELLRAEKDRENDEAVIRRREVRKGEIAAELQNIEKEKTYAVSLLRRLNGLLKKQEVIWGDIIDLSDERLFPYGDLNFKNVCLVPAKVIYQHLKITLFAITIISLIFAFEWSASLRDFVFEFKAEFQDYDLLAILGAMLWLVSGYYLRYSSLEGIDRLILDEERSQYHRDEEEVKKLERLSENIRNYHHSLSQKSWELG